MLESSNGMCGFCGKGASEVVSKSFPSCGLFLQLALRTLFAVSNPVAPTLNHGLFIGGCLRYLSMAARIEERDEMLKSFPSFCFTAA